MTIKVKRVYEAAVAGDGRRFLVDRLWPRGVAKEALQIAAWLKEAAPSNDLRHWYGHDPEKWDAFRRRYAAELDRHPESWAPLLEAARHGTITLVYSTRETERNNAVALKEYLQRHAVKKPKAPRRT